MTTEEIQARAREVFHQEAVELLGDLEQALLDLESRPGEREVIDRVFRVMHTLKGAGATSGFTALSSFVHRVEDVYNAAREGKLAVDRALIDDTLQAKDFLERGLAAGVTGEREVFAGASELLSRFGARLQETGIARQADSKALDKKAAKSRRRWQVALIPKPGVWLTGLDLGVFWDDLRALGTCELKGTLEDSPRWEEFDPEQCLLRWTASLETEAGEREIRDVFAFAGDDAEVSVIPQVETKAAVAPEVRSKEVEREVLRVGAAKVDRLVNLVGELVILRAQLQTACAALGEVSPALAAVEESLRRLSDEMREVVLEIRMMPVGDAFAKFRRVVRDLAQSMGKEVDWIVEGGETEMDKTLLDQLADPLMHMVRNSLDHGLETPEERRQAGKSPRGTLTLRAEQKGDRVWISVRDDGRGLNADKIRRKAIERGLLAPDDPREGTDLFDLIFLPGFSTADTVSQVSGRGVGMDVVRRRIEQLRGAVELHSSHGHGTEVRMSLPLTLAIVDGLLVEVGGESYILPLGAARETISVPAIELACRQRGQLVEVRGEWIPFVKLRSEFAVGGASLPEEKVVIVQTEECVFGVVVDRVLGQHQTVLKTLGWASQRVKAFSGGTVLGDGRVALVIDLAGLWTYARGVRGRQQAA